VIDREGDELVWTFRDTGQGTRAGARPAVRAVHDRARAARAWAWRSSSDPTTTRTIRPESGPSGTTFVIRMPLRRPTDGD
jgi:hypothetical protein